MYTPEDTDNYNIIEKDVYVYVNKATPTADDFDIKLPDNLYYNGYIKRASVDVKDGIVGMGSVSLYHYDEDGDRESYPTEPGKYTFKLKISSGYNYIGTTIEHEDWTFEIIYLPVEEGMYEVSNPAYEKDGVYWFKDGDTAVVVPSEDYLIATKHYYEEEVELTSDSKMKIVITRIDDFAMTDYIDLSDVIKFDDAAPTGSIAISGNKWTELQTDDDTVYLNEKLNVEITAEDIDSGVKEVVYLVSDKALDAAALEGAVWMTYDVNNKPVLESEGEYFVYAKLTDNVGNVVYLGSDKIVIDLTAPVISGITDGETYLVTTKVNVSDDNIDAVTVNDEEAGTEFGLRGNKDEEYVVVATDKAGNKTTVKVTMKTIASIAEGIEGITEETVKVSDRDAVDEVIANAEELLNGEFVDQDEKAEIEQILAGAKALDEKISEIIAAAGPNTGEGNKVFAFATIMALSFAAICFVAFKRKKNMGK